MNAAEAGGRWFDAIAAHAGPAYLRYSFTKGTEQEVAFLWSALGLGPGSRVLDVGCGPGRHALAMALRGASVVGVDIAAPFLALAAEAAAVRGGDGQRHRGGADGGADGRAAFVRGDARRLPVAPGSFDAVISLCQGGFGLLGGDDAEESAVVADVVQALRPGGRAALSAFSAYYQVRWLDETDAFDAATGVNHEQTVVRDAAGRAAPFELWTTCFTPRELRLLVGSAGGIVDHLWAVSPGDYAARPPDLDHPEWLVILHRPPG